jgi:hypothetical protein
MISPRVAALTEMMVRTMSSTGLKGVVPLVLAVALLGGGTGVYQFHADSSGGAGEVTEPPAGGAAAVAGPTQEEAKSRADMPKDGEKGNLPRGPAPVQVLARLDAGSKLVVRTAVPDVNKLGVLQPASEDAVPERGTAAPAHDSAATSVRAKTYDLDEVRVLDTGGKPVDKNALVARLKEETVAMAVFGGQPPDPLHLRVLKPGTLTFVLPAPKVRANGNPDAAPRGEPAPQPDPGAPADIAPDRKAPE